MNVVAVPPIAAADMFDPSHSPTTIVAASLLVKTPATIGFRQANIVATKRIVCAIALDARYGGRSAAGPHDRETHFHHHRGRHASSRSETPSAGTLRNRQLPRDQLAVIAIRYVTIAARVAPAWRKPREPALLSDRRALALLSAQLVTMSITRSDVAQQTRSKRVAAMAAPSRVRGGSHPRCHGLRQQTDHAQIAKGI